MFVQHVCCLRRNRQKCFYQAITKQNCCLTIQMWDECALKKMSFWFIGIVSFYTLTMFLKYWPHRFSVISVSLLLFLSCPGSLHTTQGRSSILWFIQQSKMPAFHWFQLWVVGAWQIINFSLWSLWLALFHNSLNESNWIDNVWSHWHIRPLRESSKKSNTNQHELLFPVSFALCWFFFVICQVSDSQQQFCCWQKIYIKEWEFVRKGEGAEGGSAGERLNNGKLTKKWTADWTASIKTL